MFHVYVSPIFGDNTRAWAQNPGTPGNPQPLSRHPSNDMSQGGINNGIGGLLQHAPYAFRTLTGPQGAGAYIAQVSAQFGANNHLPWSFLVGGETKLVNWVVIHCEPGMYAPLLSADPSPVPIDGRNGLLFNGEVWPFRLQHRVSIQGASALDTVFDARGQNTSVVVIDRTGVPNTVATHNGSFIDGITVRGARSDGQPMSASNGSGAGILIDRLGNTEITISNCFLVDNSVGLAVDNGQFIATAHQPRILNNTFARNVIGLWNGNREPLEQNVGRGELSILNNVFDSWLPGATAPFSSTPFAGVCAEDLLVTNVFTNQATINLVPPNWDHGLPVAVVQHIPSTSGALGRLPRAAPT